MVSRSVAFSLVNLAVYTIFLFAAITSADPSNGKEIEERRRSLDKNFMRFGRNYNPVLLVHQMRLAEGAKSPLGREMTKRKADNNKDPRSRNEHLMRIGRADNNFLRFGRNDRVYNLLSQDNGLVEQPLIPSTFMVMDRPQVRSTNSFLRFGRNMGAAEVMDPVLWTSPQTQAEGDPEEDSGLDDLM